MSARVCEKERRRGARGKKKKSLSLAAESKQIGRWNKSGDCRLEPAWILLAAVAAAERTGRIAEDRRGDRGRRRGLRRLWLLPSRPSWVNKPFDYFDTVG